MNYIKEFDRRGLAHRKDMPQFENKEDVAKLDAVVRKLGRTVKNRGKCPMKLRPMQRHISFKKAKEIDPTRAGTRILVGEDGGIIDGHHRWAAAHWRVKNGKLPKSFRLKVREYGMNATDLLKLAQGVSSKRHTRHLKIKKS